MILLGVLRLTGFIVVVGESHLGWKLCNARWWDETATSQWSPSCLASSVSLRPGRSGSLVPAIVRVAWIPSLITFSDVNISWAFLSTFFFTCFCCFWVFHQQLPWQATMMPNCNREVWRQRVGSDSNSDFFFDAGTTRSLGDWVINHGYEPLTNLSWDDPTQVVVSDLGALCPRFRELHESWW